jgi:HlyD family secretion protein
VRRWPTLTAHRDAIGQRAAQAREQGTGYGRQAVAAAEQKRLLEEELKALRPLASKGFVSVTRLRALERARAELDAQPARTWSGGARSRR